MAKPTSSLFLSHTLFLLVAFSPIPAFAGMSSLLLSDPPTFYDDPSFGYTLDSHITNWDAKRWEWLDLHPTVRRGILLGSGSQAGPCRSPIGDHLLLRLLKNKGDYCRVQGCELFYSMSLFQPGMRGYWSKLPSIQAAMVAHPEADWIWWLDSAAVFTDMDFKLPLHRYENHNLVVHGWPSLVFEEKIWTGLNSGVFLIRNCQWSLDFIDAWAALDPQTSSYTRWAKTITSTINYFPYHEHDDQAALLYLLLSDEPTWRDKVYIENEYYFQGYWVEILPSFRNMSAKYEEIERKHPSLRRRRAEKVEAVYGEEWGAELEREGVRSGYGGLRRPLVTHFTGCKPCSGYHNENYKGEECWRGMEKALDFADDQVLRSYGFRHVRDDAGDTTAAVEPLMPSDSPTKRSRENKSDMEAGISTSFSSPSGGGREGQSPASER